MKKKIMRFLASHLAETRSQLNNLAMRNFRLNFRGGAQSFIRAGDLQKIEVGGN